MCGVLHRVTTINVQIGPRFDVHSLQKIPVIIPGVLPGGIVNSYMAVCFHAECKDPSYSSPLQKDHVPSIISTGNQQPTPASSG